MVWRQGLAFQVAPSAAGHRGLEGRPGRCASLAGADAQAVWSVVFPSLRAPRIGCFALHQHASTPVAAIEQPDGIWTAFGAAKNRLCRLPSPPGKRRRRKQAIHKASSGCGSCKTRGQRFHLPASMKTGQLAVGVTRLTGQPKRPGRGAFAERMIGSTRRTAGQSPRLSGASETPRSWRS